MPGLVSPQEPAKVAGEELVPETPIQTTPENLVANDSDGPNSETGEDELSAIDGGTESASMAQTHPPTVTSEPLQDQPAAAPTESLEDDLAATQEPQALAANKGAVADQRRGWWQLDDGRWVVGEAGQIPVVVPLPAPPWSRPDIATDGAAFGSIAFRAASIRGVSHQLYGKPRQDSYAYRPTRCGNWLIGCVADGVSQGRLSHIAADIACRETTGALAETIEGLEIPATSAEWSVLASGLPWQVGVDATSDAIVTEATESVRTLYIDRDDRGNAETLADSVLSDKDAAKVMATTAIVFIVATSSNSEGLVPYALAVAAGDSSAFILSDLHWQPITEIKNLGSEIASSAVHPLPARRSVSPAIGCLAQGDALVVMTDGVGDPLGSGTGVVGRFLSHSWSTPCDPLAFGAQVGFIRKTFVDDRTAFAVWNIDP